MSNAHKGSRLALKNQLIPVKFNTAHFNFNEDAIGIQYGELVRPQGTPVFTLRKEEGILGNSVAVEAGCTNLVLIGDSRWSISKSNYQGEYSIKQYDRFSTVSRFDFKPRTDPATSGWQVAQYSHNITSWSTAKTYTWSVYIRRLTNDNVSVRLLDGNGLNPQGGVVTFSGNIGEWSRISHTWTPTVTTGGGLFYVTSGENASFELADPQVEEKAYATSFVNGSRTQGVIEYPKETFPAGDFTVNMWIAHTGDNRTGNVSTKIFALGDDYLNCRLTLWNYFPISSDNANRRIIMDSGNGTGRQAKDLISPILFTPYVWEMLTVTFDYASKTFKAYRNGVYWDTLTVSVLTGIHKVMIFDSGWLYSEIRIDSSIATNEEIMAWYVSGNPHYNPYDYRAYTY